MYRSDQPSVTFMIQHQSRNGSRSLISEGSGAAERQRSRGYGGLNVATLAATVAATLAATVATLAATVAATLAASS